MNETLSKFKKFPGPLLFIIPLAWQWICTVSRVNLPIDKWEYFFISSLFTLIIFLIIWFYRFRKIELDKNLKITFICLFIYWLITGFSFWAYANEKFDFDTNKNFDVFDSLVTEVKTTQPGMTYIGGFSGATCLVKTKKTFQGVDEFKLKYDQCAFLTPNVDGVHLRFKKGFLHFTWKYDNSIIKIYRNDR